MSRERNLIKKMQRMERKAQPQTPIAQDIFIPNHSGDHQAGKVFKTPVSDYDIANKKYVDDNAGGGGASALSDLSDVDASVATPSDGDIIVYRDAGSDWVLEAKPAGGSNPAMADITDVTITTVGNNDIIAYNSATSTYINQTAAEAGLAAASHTHTAANITDFDTEVANNSAVSANTAKVSYPGSASAAELNILDGATLTTAELNYVDGVTSAIQTQIDSKLEGVNTAKITVSSSTPSSPSTGDLWVDTT